MTSSWKPETYTDERRVSHPSMGLRLDYANSVTLAAKEFCRQCMQARNCSDCPSRSCPLFPYRPGADDKEALQRRPGVDVPTKEWYEEQIRLKDPDGSKAAVVRERFALARAANVAVSEDDMEVEEE